VNTQSLEQANALLAALSRSTSVGEIVTVQLADVGREVDLPSPLALARAVRALVSRGRLVAEEAGYRLVEDRPIEAGEKITVAPRGGRRSRKRAEPSGEPGVPSYADIGRSVVDRLIELARETAEVAELANVRRELREERSARVRAEERATELHHRVRDLEGKLDMAEENLRRVIGVVRQKSAEGKPTDPETQALLAILRGANGGAARNDEEPPAADETA